MLSGVVVRNKQELYKRVRIRNSGGDTLPVLTTAILANSGYGVRGYPTLSSMSTTVRVLQRLNYGIVHSNRAIRISSSIVAMDRVPSSLVHRVHSSVIFLNTILTHTNGTRVSSPKNYRVNLEPVSLRLSSVQGLNTRVARRRNELCYSLNGDLRNTSVALSFPDIKTARGVVVTTTTTSKAAIVAGTTQRPRVDSLTSFLGNYNTGVSNTNSDAMMVRNAGELRNAYRAIVPSHVRTSSCLVTTSTANNEVYVGSMVPTRVNTLVPILSRTNYSVAADNE